MVESQGIFSFPCPHCGTRLDAEPRMVGKRGRCKSCGLAFAIPPPAASLEDPSPSRAAAAPPVQGESPTPESSKRQKRRPVRAATQIRERKPPPLDPASPFFADAFAKRADASHGQASAGAGHALHGELIEAQPAEVSVVQNAELARPSRRSPGIMLSSRWLWYPVFYSLWLGPHAAVIALFLLASAVDEMEVAAGMCCLFVLVGVPWFGWGHFPARWLTPLILAVFIRSVRCPGCGEVHSLIGRWSCSCGYTDHRQWHALLFRCPKCTGRLGYLDCPMCGSTIIF